MRVDTVRYAMTWSDGFLTVPRGSCTDRPLKNFAALHRLRWLSVMELGAHSKRQKPQRLLAAAFDICFDKCCLLKSQIPLAIKHLRALYGGEGGTNVPNRQNPYKSTT